MFVFSLCLISFLFGATVQAEDFVILKVEFEVWGPDGKIIGPARLVLFEDGYIEETPKAISIYPKKSESFVSKPKGKNAYIPTQIKRPQKALVLKEVDQTFEDRKCDLFNSTDRKLEICFHSGDFRKFTNLRDTMKTYGTNNGYNIPPEIINSGFPIALYLEIGGFKIRVKKLEDGMVPKFDWKAATAEAQFFKLYPKRL